MSEIDDPDLPLVRRMAEGDAQASELLVRRRLGSVLGLARRMLADLGEAEDVAQETFLRAWRAAATWREGEARFETWMHKVAINLCYDRLRRRREKPTLDAGLNVLDPAPGASDTVLARQRSKAVQAALDQLPDRQRAAIVLCHFQELSNIEAAAALDVSVDALESLLSRGRRALRASLLPRRFDLVGAVDGPE